MKRLLYFIACLLLAAFFTDARAQTKRHSIFRPVLRSAMRDMETDRPDVTESPYTVNAGHFQLETDLYKHTTNRSLGIKRVEDVYNSLNLKVGLTQSMDLQLITDLYSRASEGPGASSNSSFSDLTFRLKHNFFGNDKGKVALAMLPYLVVPTKRSHAAYEAGITFPVAVELKNDWGLGAQLQVSGTFPDGEPDETTSLGSVTLGKALGEKLDAFGETFITYGFQEKRVRVSYNSGVILSVSKDVKFDTGFNYGLTKETDRLFFIGFSFRY